MIRAILTDIEGTTSSIAFVKDVLFPYARQRLASFIQAHRDEAGVATALADVSQMVGRTLTVEEATRELLDWIDQDRKATPLKALQGMIWEAGYRQGDFHGHLYEDAARQLRAWKSAGLDLYIFSSGSVQAQKLLFAHTTFGDLTPLFSGYFDTRIGAKQEPAAYRTIAEQIGLRPGDILFLSDVGAELDAARAAGLATVQLVRPPDPPPQAAHPIAVNFDQIDPL